MIGARSRLLGCLAAVVLVGGCGSGGSHPAQHVTTGQHRSTAPATGAPPSAPAPKVPLTVPDPGPTGTMASAAAVRVIRAWSDALRHGDVRAAARRFALPSVMINGGGGDISVNRIDTPRQALAANAMLPCGARFLSADMRGRYVNALFELTGRPGAGGTNCGHGAGATARTNFVISHGRIIEWIRAPDDPGDNSSGPTA